MRNYLFSIAVHVVLLLILLAFSFSSSKPEEEQIENVVLVDFSSTEDVRQRPMEVKESTTRPVLSKPNISSPPKNQVKERQAEFSKIIEKKPLQSSQKPKAESSQILEERSPVVKKIIPPLKDEDEIRREAEQERAKQRAKEKAKKFNRFKSLLSKAKTPAATGEIQHEENTVESEETSDHSIPLKSGKNIQATLGNRKVLRTPVIQDKSQKKGRVVVRICVGSHGKVLSSKYTMMGSTTNDSYLIGLAEKGASEYLFSPSSNPKECGKVVIDFQLK